MSELNVEVGPRDSPKIDWLRDDLRGKGKVLLIEKRMPWIVNMASNNIYPKSKIIQAVGNNLPLKDGSVSMIFASDLYSAHNKYAIDGQGKYTIENIGEGLEKEWSRVCKRGGKVIILEFSDPVEKNGLIKRFDGLGFDLVEDNGPGEVGKIFKDRYAEVISRQSNNMFDRYALKSFSLVFKKT